MKDNKKINLTDTQEKRKTNITFKQFIKRGFSQISYNRWKTIVFTILTTILIITLLNFKNFNFNIPFVTENIIIAFINDICNIDIPQNILIPILLTILYILMVIALMIPIGYKEKEEILYKAKFINNKKETSIFIRQFLNKLNKNVVIWEFLSNGVPYSYWL